MLKNILITGMPKSGKSTILGKVIAELSPKVGFITREVLNNGERVGFQIQTHLGNTAMLAHVDFTTPYKVSKYGVAIDNLDSVIPEVSNFTHADILYLDEIGQMELFSTKFKNLVISYLDSSNTCIATVSQIYQDNFITDIKKRDDVFVIEITENSRESQENFIRQLLGKIEKARRYIAEPIRFTRHGLHVDLRSEHGIRHLSFVDGAWKCSCDFFAEYHICSHIIATQEVVKNSI